jgi:coenzyme F420-0:L-glutamate ligase/coenzyme F420-1:gamma-L-glutamate ligase
MRSATIELIPLKSFPVVNIGDDIAKLILTSIQENKILLSEGDIIVVTHSIISVSEGSFYKIVDLEVSDRARQIAKKIDDDPRRVEAALRESELIIREEPVFITKTRHGIVTDFSGIDESNAPPDSFLFLPEDPDKSARTIHQVVAKKTGFNIPVIITDTQGRPWRRGAVNIAIGLAGMSPFVVNRGKQDLYERELRGSLVCVADQVAAATELIMGQAGEGIPVVIVRGIEYEVNDGRASEILRGDSEDLFSQ